MEAKGVYVHVPFCKTICSYCDFCKVFYNERWAKKYLLSLKEEIKDIYMNDPIDTIYIGGGTPSALSLEYLQQLLEIINNLNIFFFPFERSRIYF